MVAQFIVGIAFLSVFGWAVKHRTKGDLDVGWANVIVDQLAGFLTSSQGNRTSWQVAWDVRAYPKWFESINHLENDVLTLTAYSNEDDGRTIAIGI